MWVFGFSKMKKRKGVSIIEIGLCALALMVFAAVGMINGGSFLNSEKVTEAKTNASQISTAISRYKYEVGSYPPNLQALTGTSGVYGPWLSSPLPATDPWGITTSINGTGGASVGYCYSYTANGFAVWSFGVNHVNNSGGTGTTLPTSIATDDIGFIGR